MIIEKILVSVSSNNNTLVDSMKSVTRRKVRSGKRDNSDESKIRLYKFFHISFGCVKLRLITSQGSNHCSEFDMSNCSISHKHKQVCPFVYMR